jgi:uncharacterized repeat protein (TIGR03803 family)
VQKIRLFLLAHHSLPHISEVSRQARFDRSAPGRNRQPQKRLFSFDLPAVVRWAPLISSILFLFGFVSCGGVAGKNSPAAASITSVSVSCAPSSVSTGQTSQCTATVVGTGSYSSAVTWSASAGTINSSGLFTAPDSAGSATITATSAQDITQSGTAAVSVKAPTITSLSVSCSPATIYPGQTSQCTATVKGTGSYSSAVTWSASAGTIDSSGLFTAPDSAGSVTVTATSAQDTAKSGTAAVSVKASTITSLSVSCSPATIQTGGASQCTATVKGTGSYSSAVTWRAGAGTIDPSGLFTAPGSTGSVAITATSTQDTAKSGTAAVAVTPAPAITSLSVSCNPATIYPGQTSQCTATVKGIGSYSSAVTWSAGAGTISSSGLFTAPGSTGSVTVTATSTEDPAKSGSTTVAAVQITLTPTSVTVPEGGMQTFAASVAGIGNGVMWSVQEGSAGGTFVNATLSSAIYVPPAAAGTFHVVATSADSSGITATATVTVVPAVTLTVLHSFSGVDGQLPSAGGLIQGSDGNFYGLTGLGGASGAGAPGGTIFKMDASGNLNVLHSFSSSEGYAPSAMIQGSDGNFYGTTSNGGGSADAGTLFEMDASSDVTFLYSFSGSDGMIPAAVVQGGDGALYGVTREGGASTKCQNGSGNVVGCGTVFMRDTSGTVSIVHWFSGSDGAFPSLLVPGPGGSLYGATAYGGAGTYAGTTSRPPSGDGTIFKIDASGSLTVLHSFSGSDGETPCALLQGSDGNLYGATCFGGTGYGTTFKMDSTGVLTVLHVFSGYDGGGGSALALIQAGDGNFYGASTNGGTYQGGTVFRMDALGDITVLWSFEDYPASLIQGSDNNFYGATWYGGVSGTPCEYGCGTVFKMDFPGQ